MQNNLWKWSCYTNYLAEEILINHDVNVLLISWSYQFVNIVAAQIQLLQAAQRFLIFIKIIVN
jgi:hypothetical protein